MLVGGADDLVGAWCQGYYSGSPLVYVGTEVAVQVYSVRAARRLLVGTFDGAVWLGGCSAG